MARRFQLSTGRNGLFDITPQIAEAVAASGVVEGIAVVATPHTTAGITMVSYHDPLGLEDVNDEIGRIIPTRIDFKHQYDTPQDAAAHIKTAIVGTSHAFIVEAGQLCLGSSQKIYFWEFDGPRQRSFMVQIAPAAGAR
jgi:secondary thiamine-phosphate synthase enzyme